ncbi:MAG TPA: FAD-binding oxidoreductase [Hyphomicrobiaceae bacterium]|nr:FAD-binding oxidoreductase [Hyphomicrobiaceae bacterium]
MNGSPTADVIVLGAGIVGVSTALHLQKRGRNVVLVDRRGAGEETSYGNTGIIQREGVVPYPFPRQLGLMAQYALNHRPEANLHWSALPRIAPWLLRYWASSTPERLAATARAARPLIERCVIEHEALMVDAGIAGMMRRTGYLRFYRTAAALQAEIVKDQEWRKTYGINFEVVDAAQLAELEPHLRGSEAGGVWMPQPVSVADPSGVSKAYARLLVERGGRFLQGDARTLAPSRGGWRVTTADGPVDAPAAVVALGPWSDDVLRPLGYRIPLGVKRGYHMHFKAEGNATLNRPIIDVQYGYALTPMVKGIRLTTGAEFALRDAPPTPVQLGKSEPLAREIFPLGARVDAEPWLGRRPCLPDMLPMVARAHSHDGLWLNFGHHHLGFTMGPVTGRLLAEMLTGEQPFTDPEPYRSDRF